VTAGLLRPNKTKDDANRRIEVMGAELAALIRDVRPAVIVVEDTSGKVGHNRHGGGGAGLAIYGKAIGYMTAVANASGFPVAMVKENDWTRGTPKAIRTARVKQWVRNYDESKDPGGDMADAIGLGKWYAERAKVQRAGGMK